MSTYRFRTYFIVSLTIFILQGLKIVNCLDDALVSNPKEVLRLKNDLQSKFNPEVRPVNKSSTKTKLDIFFTIGHINEINDVQQTMTVSASVSMFWTNELLRWNPRDYGNVSMMVFNDWDLWKPDIRTNSFKMKNSISVYRRTLDGITIYYHGLNFNNFLTELKIPCKFDFYNFPKDVQTCTIAIFSFHYNLAEMDINFYDNESAVVYLSGLDQSKKYIVGWKFLKIEQFKRYTSDDEFGRLIYVTNSPSDETISWPILLVKLTLIRHRPYFVVIELICFITTSLLTLSIFWVDEENIYALISVINILLQAIISWGVLNEFPASDGSLPKIIIVYGLHFGLTCAAFFVSMILDSISNWNIKLPVSVETMVNKMISHRFFGVKSLSFQQSERNRTNKESCYEKVVDKNLLKILCRTFFILYFFIYIALLILLLN